MRSKRLKEIDAAILQARIWGERQAEGLEPFLGTPARKRINAAVNTANLWCFRLERDLLKLIDRVVESR